MSADKLTKLKILTSELRTNTEYANELQHAISLIPNNKVRTSLEEELAIKQIIIDALIKEISETKEGELL